jgi:hypothetical protein
VRRSPASRRDARFSPARSRQSPPTSGIERSRHGHGISSQSNSRQGLLLYGPRINDDLPPALLAVRHIGPRRARRLINAAWSRLASVGRPGTAARVRDPARRRATAGGGGRGELERPIRRSSILRRTGYVERGLGLNALPPVVHSGAIGAPWRRLLPCVRGRSRKPEIRLALRPVRLAGTHLPRRRNGVARDQWRVGSHPPSTIDESSFATVEGRCAVCGRRAAAAHLRS